MGKNINKALLDSVEYMAQRGFHGKTIDKALLDSVEYMAQRGFHGKTIAKAVGLTEGQVLYRTSRLNIKLRAYRDGATVAAREIINVTPCVVMHVKGTPGTPYKVAPMLRSKE